MLLPNVNDEEDSLRLPRPPSPRIRITESPHGSSIPYQEPWIESVGSSMSSALPPPPSRHLWDGDTSSHASAEHVTSEMLDQLVERKIKQLAPSDGGGSSAALPPLPPPAPAPANAHRGQPDDQHADKSSRPSPIPPANVAGGPRKVAAVNGDKSKSRPQQSLSGQFRQVAAASLTRMAALSPPPALDGLIPEQMMWG
ncbi:hypothetical protein GUITHDRAFT_117809 [Guillardia theta CCMP2712]|uniref:Uncharacterized protein n=1 Tax=Guillardia theta (strain CCMP2712) TaxID=905079 RepID=L1IIG5_GUITC|nr:hypothetical protein GUITHDRAFT_117809 [Guillardia theta CCMP2712]EKX36021.1 hypothetical protein GUITHDRAFT_117809 [Guillardia theta CCMP2712]|eukprot:XP_005823001.1 hypothetical protein GUITHDRAFT_117809 [Guillardia theta CCMP2712]